MNQVGKFLYYPPFLQVLSVVLWHKIKGPPHGPAVPRLLLHLDVPWTLSRLPEIATWTACEWTTPPAALLAVIWPATDPQQVRCT